MKIIKTIGEIIYALPFAAFGVFHFLNTDALAQSVPKYLPQPSLWVYLTGAIFIVTALLIVVRKYVTVGAGVLAAQLFILALLVQLPAALSDDPQMSTLGTIMFLKDIALAAGAFVIAGAHCRCKECAVGAEGESGSESGGARTAETETGNV